MTKESERARYPYTKLGAGAVAIAGAALLGLKALSGEPGNSPQEAALQEFKGRRPVAAAVNGPVMKPPLVVEEPAERPALPAPLPEPLAKEPAATSPNAPEPLKDEPPAKEQRANRLVRTALELCEKYEHLEYVWGGESPYSHGETIMDPFFDGIDITKKQPPGSWRKGQPSVPGFDCAGWAWYVGKKAGMKPFIDVRASAEGYRNHSSGKRIWDGRYSSEMENKMKPGDFLFIMEGRRAKHMALYLGNSKIMECSGRERPDYKNISPEGWQRWREYARPEKYGKTDWDRGGLQISRLSKYSGGMVSVRRF